MSHIRSYNSSVLVGNWFEDIALKEELTKDFLERKEKGTLLSQQLKRIFGSSDSQVSLSPCPDGGLKYGDRVQLLNAGADPLAIRMQKAVPRKPMVLCVSISPNVLKNATEISDSMPVSASANIAPQSRNIFEIVSASGAEVRGQPVLYGQPFQLVTCNEERYYLASDSIGMGDRKPKHRNQQVVMSRINHFNTHWKAEFYHPQLRMEHEMTLIATGKIVILKHCKTNQALCLENDCSSLTLFGPEIEVSAKTAYTDHKAEADVNYWILAAGTQALDASREIGTSCEEPTQD